MLRKQLPIQGVQSYDSGTAVVPSHRERRAAHKHNVDGRYSCTEPGLNSILSGSRFREYHSHVERAIIKAAASASTQFSFVAPLLLFVSPGKISVRLAFCEPTGAAHLSFETRPFLSVESTEQPYDR